MNNQRIAGALVAAACCAALAACNRSSAPDDAQLTMLLHSERATANDPNAPLDAQAVNCLRAWSGDVELSASLPPSVANDAAKTACRQRLDGWIADATRNPAKLRFEDVSTPPAVKRAVALLAAHRANSMAMTRLPSANDRPPAAMTPGAPAAAPADSGPVDLTAAVKNVDELDALCKKAKQASATGGSTQPLARYASYCDKRIEQMRTRISSIQQHGNAQQAQAMTNDAERTLEAARRVASQGSGGAPKARP